MYRYFKDTLHKALIIVSPAIKHCCQYGTAHDQTVTFSAYDRLNARQSVKLQLLCDQTYLFFITLQTHTFLVVFVGIAFTILLSIRLLLQPDTLAGLRP